MSCDKPVTSADVETIAQNVVHSFFKGDAFLSTIHQAVREGVQKELGRIIDRLDSNEAKIMDLENKVDALSSDIVRLQRNIEHRESKVADLKREINAQEQYSRRNCLRFYGVPESANENTDDLIRCDVS